MKTIRIWFVMLASALMFTVAQAQETMSSEDWQNEMNKYTQMRDEVKAKVDNLTNQIGMLQSQREKLEADNTKCLDALYALVGSDATKAEAFRTEIANAEQTAGELLALPDAEIAARMGVVKDLDKKAKAFRANKLSLIPEFDSRISALEGNIKALMGKEVTGERIFTVGTWSGDGHCLWHIAEQVYADGMMWPKIFVGNRAQINNPDIIHPGQQLKIPVAGELTREEKQIARSYYDSKVSS